MLRASCLLAAVVLGGCVGAPVVRPAAGPPPAPRPAAPPPESPAPIATLLPGFFVTNYTLALEHDPSAERPRNDPHHPRVVHPRVSVSGLRGTYAWEFLCSGRGVAMQGTGVTRDGRYVRYVSGGGGFCGRDHHLCRCRRAKFAQTTGVFGASGRSLVEDFSIAVDPAVIAYGSSVWIDAMKRWFRADDTGGAIRGNRIDVYIGTRGRVFTGDTSVFVSPVPHAADDPPPPGVDASCAADGFVCGGDGVTGDPRMLFRCHDSHLTFERLCAFGCRASQSGAADACNPRPPLPYCADEGLHCGGDRADGDLGALYRCVDHGLVLEEACSRGCVVDPDGVADACR
jgi:3D (Asp-Asp-Asp) domain-containing protein